MGDRWPGLALPAVETSLKRQASLACVALVPLLVLGLAARPVVAQSTVYGAIESLDDELGTITLLLPPKHEPRQFNLAKANLPVANALGKPLKLTDLHQKQRVALQLDEADDVAAIRLDDNVLWAYIVKTDVKARQLLVKFGRTERLLSVPAAVEVLRDGQKTDLNDLAVGQGIKAIFAADEQTLAQIQCGKGISGVSPYHRWILQSGISLKVDQANRKFQIVTTSQPIKLEDYTFDRDAMLRLFHSSYLLRTTGMAAFHPFCKVSFYYESDSKEVVQISALVPTLVRCRVESVERDARRLTVQTGEKTPPLNVAADAMFRNQKGLATWADVRAEGLVTCGLSLDNREVVYVYIWD